MSEANTITHKGTVIENADWIERVKPVYGDTVRVYFGSFDDPDTSYSQEFNDPDHSLYLLLSSMLAQPMSEAE